MTTSVTTSKGGKTVIRPLGDNVLVMPIKPAEKIGKLYIPIAAQDRRKEGTVIEVGPGRWNDHHFKFNPMRMKKGDHILFAKWAGTDITVDGKEVLMVTADDILGIVEDSE